MALPTTFANLTAAEGSQLDDNFNALGALTPIPCTVAGTNTITMTPAANTPTVAAYSNYMQFTGVAAATNTGAATAQVGSLAALSIYKDTVAGPVLLTGGEIVQNTKLILMYDSTLNSNAGGFHLVGQASPVVRDKSTIATLTFGALAPNTGSTATITLGGASVADVVGIGFPSAPSIGIAWTGYVPNAGTVVISAFNTFWTTATVTPPSGGYRVVIRGYGS